ncbi:MAG: MBL fold metallo-hydrolase [bacterium]|nr:MBL fold metallo-hydrolase [bacterium]
MATVTSYGAAGEVTGSRHVFSVNGKQILLDCGLFQGKRQESYDKSRHFGFDAAKIDAVILSHAHLDHCGALPRLLAEGFKGSIYLTPATAEISEFILLDSAFLQVRDIEFINKKHRRRGFPEHRPLYTPEDIPGVVARYRKQQYHESFEPVPGVRCKLLDAGHILGSAQVVLEWGDTENPHRFVFSGDLGRNNLPILNDPETPPTPDTLMIETTYGGRLHDPIELVREELAIEIDRIVANRGAMLVPAFSVERTQELLYVLAELVQSGRIPQLPVYVDSPLAKNVTEVFRKHRELVDRDFRKLLESSDPFGSKAVKFTKTVEDSMALNSMDGPLIILAGSGMCEGGTDSPPSSQPDCPVEYYRSYRRIYGGEYFR